MRTVTKFFCVLTVFLFLSACSTPDTPEAVAKKYVELMMVKGDAEGVMKIINIPDKEKKAGVEDMLRGKIKAEISRKKEWAEKNGGVKNIEAGEVKVYEKDTNYASVPITINFKNGKQDNTNVRVIKTDKGWKINI